MSPGGNNEPGRYEWGPSGKRLTGIVHGPWVCDCHDYGLKPRPNGIGECQTCYRPVYGIDGERVVGEHYTPQEGANDEVFDR